MTRDMSTTEFVKTVATIAEHYGFAYDRRPPQPKSFSTPVLSPHTAPPAHTTIDSLIAESLASFTDGERNHQHPTLFYRVTATPTNDTAITFHIYNVERSVAEALLINLTHTVAREINWEDPLVRINSIGDTDSVTRYTREVTNFLRKRLDHVDGNIRELMKQHPLHALRALIANDHDLSYKSPSPLEYLSDQSRKHFREIIEFLDVSNTAYEIDARMIGHHECYSDTIFEILNQSGDDSQAPSVTIRGGRHDELVYRGTKRRTGAVSAVTILHNRPLPARLPRTSIPPAEVYLIQLGFGPKLRTLLLIDDLRRHGVTVIQNIASDSLSAQLRDAETRNIPYVMIMGQKEFVDGTVILRDMKQRTQEAISPIEACKRIKRNRSLISRTRGK